MARKAMTRTPAATAVAAPEPVAENITKVAEPVENKVTEKKIYDLEETIPCKSVINGLLLVEGVKSKLLYRWADYGDVENIEYQDLLFMVRSHEKAVFNPRFIIMDDEFVAQNSDLKELYSTLYSTKDIKDILNLPLAQMKATIMDMPKTLQKTVCDVAATMIERKQLDSVQKVKALDEIFGTKLFLTLTLE